MPLFPPQDDSLWQKMMQLVCEGDVAGLKAWVKAGGDVNQDFYDSFGEPRRLLTFAATDGDADMVRALLAQGADIDGLEEGRTALATAVVACIHPAYDTTEIVKVLIEAGASVDEIVHQHPFTRRGQGEKPLLCSATHRPGVLCALLRAGADSPSLHTRGGSNIEKYVKDEFDENIKWMKSGEGDGDAYAESARNLEKSGHILAAVRIGGNYTGHSGKRYVIDGIVQDV